MHRNLFTSLSVLAGVAAAAPATERQARATAPWVATNVQSHIDGFVGDGVSFDLSVPAENTPGAPAFDVSCIAFYGSSAGQIPNFYNCNWNGPQPKYSAVLAETDGDLQVTVQHQFLAADGLSTQISAVTTLPAAPNFNVQYTDLTFQVSDSVVRLPGTLGLGTWTATEAGPVRNSTGDQIGLQCKLSAPEGYTLDAPGFDVSCSYIFKGNTPDYFDSVTCTPSGTVAEGSQISWWAGFNYERLVAYHEWTAANGTKYQLMGDVLMPLDDTVPATFTIEPNVLKQL